MSGGYTVQNDQEEIIMKLDKMMKDINDGMAEATRLEIEILDAQIKHDVAQLARLRRQRSGTITLQRRLQRFAQASAHECKKLDSMTFEIGEDVPRAR